MIYHSTRDKGLSVSAATAIVQGISREGGLFVPEQLPVLSASEMGELCGLSYPQRASRILSRFLTDFSKEELDGCVTAAYPGAFRDPAVAPLKELGDGLYALELWHGPTCAFKDLALQILPHLMRTSAAKVADGREIDILVATSGDTGKAALEGFKDAPGTQILVFYPENGVSPMQKLQMTTQEGGNVGVCAIRGNFDDAQSGLKAIFTDPAVADRLQKHNRMFSSANSINWGRLVPQIVYYFSAYADLLASGAIQNGEEIVVVVPTGNFGNILAAYYAKRMGLPIGRFVCASNRNRVLTDFLTTGVYSRNRAFYQTTSPSMDILISSNLERLLYEMSNQNDTMTARLMKELSQTGEYAVSPELLKTIQELFAAGWCDDQQTAAAIRDIFDRYGYLCDTHTAVAMQVYREYRARTGDGRPAVVASTASPYKFPASVLAALGQTAQGDEFDQLEQLSRVSQTPIPAPLAAIRGKTPRFREVCNKEEMPTAVLRMLGL